MPKKKSKKSVVKKKVVAKSVFQKYRWMMFGIVAGVVVSLFFIVV